MIWRKRFTKPCAEQSWAQGVQRGLLAVTALAVSVLSGCGLLPSDTSRPPPSKAPDVAPDASGAARTGVGRSVKLPPPSTPRTWNDARAQAARRMVEASPDQSYMGPSPGVLLAIPVLTIELNADGSVRGIDVMRYPSQARDTVQLAIQAVHRAAPYGNVSKLPKPWKFNETFLFNDQRQFKPMTLDRR